MTTVAATAEDRGGRRGHVLLILVVAGLLALGLRGAVFWWTAPWTPHHADEHFLPLESLAMWEGITPRELGWPATTTRLALSGLAAVDWAAQEGAQAWRDRAAPDAVLTGVSTWIGAQYADLSRLFQLGRWLSLTVGLAQLVLTYWAARQWLPEVGSSVATLATAVSPMAVVHAQFVLADIFGLFAATAIVGLAGRPSATRIVWMGAWAALATASKFHFGLWLAVPVVIALTADRAIVGSRLRALVLPVVAFATTLLALVPWFWTAPPLMLKEFAGVVLDKVGGGAPPGIVLSNLTLLAAGVGWVTVVGAVAGLWAAWPAWRRWVPVVLPTALGLFALAGSAKIFDRHGLVLLPGAVLLAGCAWEAAFDARRRVVRLIGTAALVVATAATAFEAWRVERTAAEADVDTLAAQWILGHIPRGRRLAVAQESNAFLPRSAAQLQACADDLLRGDAYQQKWRTFSDAQPSATVRPVEALVLNDERFRAFWCRRLLAAQQDEGYWVLDYHRDPRYAAFLEREVVEDFRTSRVTVTPGIDVLVTNRPVDAGMAPAVTLTTRRGQRVIYVK